MVYSVWLTCLTFLFVHVHVLLIANGDSVENYTTTSSRSDLHASLLDSTTKTPEDALTVTEEDKGKEKKKRDATWIFYVVALGLTIPLLFIFIWFQIKGIHMKERLDKELFKSRYEMNQRQQRYKIEQLKRKDEMEERRRKDEMDPGQQTIKY